MSRTTTSYFDDLRVDFFPHEGGVGFAVEGGDYTVKGIHNGRVYDIYRPVVLPCGTLTTLDQHGREAATATPAWAAVVAHAVHLATGGRGPSPKGPTSIKLSYRSLDGCRKRGTYKTLKGAAAFAQKWAGEHPEVGSFYAVTADGIGRVSWTGTLDGKPVTPEDLWPSA